MPTYRRRKGNDTWHWRRNCSNWPTTNYEEVTTAGRPTTGELDNEYRSKENEGNCRQS
jgi:hypothetical protein